MRKSIKWFEKEIKDMYYIQGKTDREIGEIKGGVSRSRVEQIRKRFNIPGIKKRPYGKRTR